jgi:hypothetical protein
MKRFLPFLVLLSAVTLMRGLLGGSDALADPVKCQKTIVQQLARFKGTKLVKEAMCLDKENKGKIPGPCPDPLTQLRIATINQKVVDSIAKFCTIAEIQGLGFRNDCAYESATVGREGQCAALPVSTSAEFAQCLECWKGAEIDEYIALLYASHALETCGGDVGESSSICSDLDCTTPLPVQRSLGDNPEGDCQRAIGRAGINYLRKRERLLEKCGLAGGTRASCLADLKIQAALLKAEQSKSTLINKACPNRVPTPAPVFCCKTGPANACLPAATRDDCTMVLSGSVQEGKTCNVGTCQPTMGPNKPITWWGFCPENSSCPGAALSNITDLISCVDTSADGIVDELLCLQFRSGGGADWPCPASDGSPSGAFVDGKHTAVF